MTKHSQLAEDSHHQKEQKQANKQTRTSKSAVAFNIITLLIACVALISSIVFWQSYRTINSKIQTQIGELQASTINLHNNTLAQQTATKDTLTKLNNNIRLLMNERQNISATASISEAIYIIRLANVQCTLGYDMATCLKLLKLANNRLSNINTHLAEKLKKALKADMNTVSAIPPINIVALATQLNNVSNAIEALTPPKHNLPSIAKAPKQQDKSSTWWQRLKHNLSGFKNLVVIHHNTLGDNLILSTPQTFMFYKYRIQLKLAQAQWAILHFSPTLYKQSLNDAITLLKKYKNNNESVERIIENIQQLLKANIHTLMLKQLNAYLVITTMPTNNPVTDNTPEKK